jgi:thymidylate synthase (FAD)
MPEEVKVLDNGYVKFIEKWGGDERIIEAARMSTNKGFQGWGGPCDCEHGMRWNNYGPFLGHDQLKLEACTKCKNGQTTGDEKLLAYLWNHKHHTPFEMAGMVIEVQAPIMVFREWHRHRTQSYNEMSGRYTELPDLYYVPSIERLMAGKQAKQNKQSSEGGFTDVMAKVLQMDFHDSYQNARRSYEAMLQLGVAREIARLILPVNQYSRMRASANLRNWLAFLSLRMAPDAQWEIRQFANVLGDLIGEHFPRTYTLFTESQAPA